MATYSYEIVTKEGKKKKGNVEADSIDKALYLSLENRVLLWDIREKKKSQN